MWCICTAAFAFTDCPLDHMVLSCGQGYSLMLRLGVTSLAPTPTRSQMRAENTRLTSELKQGLSVLMRLESHQEREVYKFIF